jgi:hypothetical protein
MAACAQCGTALPRGATACPECGTPVPRPARKPAAKKAPTKAPAKTAARPAARKAPPAKAPARRAVRAAVPPDEPAEPAALEPGAPEPGARERVAEPVPAEAAAPAAAPVTPRALWQRYGRGDWRGPLRVGLLALAATVVLSALAALTVFVAPERGRDPAFGTFTVGRWLHFTCATVGLAFGSNVAIDPTVDDQGGFFGDIFSWGWGLAFVPLTVTVLALAAIWIATRRLRTADRTADAVRTGAVFGVGAAIVTVFSRTRVFEGEDALRVWVLPWKALAGAFLAAAVTTWLATTPQPLPARSRRWVVATRAAAFGVGVGILCAVALLVAFAYDTPGEARVNADQATRGITTAVPFGVNLGTATFGGLSTLHIRLPNPDEVGFWPLWSEDVTMPYRVALLSAPLSVLAAVLSLRRRVEPADLPGTAAMTAVPAAAIWLALAVAGTARLWLPAGLGFTVRGGFGATPSHAVAVALWFGIGGWLAGTLLARRAFDQRVDGT